MRKAVFFLPVIVTLSVIYLYSCGGMVEFSAEDTSNVSSPESVSQDEGNLSDLQAFCKEAREEARIEFEPISEGATRVDPPYFDLNEVDKNVGFEHVPATLAESGGCQTASPTDLPVYEFLYQTDTGVIAAYKQTGGIYSDTDENGVYTQTRVSECEPLLSLSVPDVCQDNLFFAMDYDQIWNDNIKGTCYEFAGDRGKYIIVDGGFALNPNAAPMENCVDGVHISGANTGG